MTGNEFYFMCLVLGGFGAFALALALGTVHDRRWAAVQSKKTRR